jgi:hypothetical protein
MQDFGLGSKPGGGERDFLYSIPTQTGPGATQPPLQWLPELFPGTKAAGEYRWPPIPI